MFGGFELQMKIQYMSDLHLEGSMMDIDNRQEADLLVLAGDITTAKSYKNHYDFFKKCSESFKDVVYVFGNHEFYRGDIEETRDELLEWLYRNFKNIHLLDNECIHRDGYVIFGGTFWTDCNGGDPLTKETIRNGMNDYRLIQWKSREHWKLRPEDTIELHHIAVNSLVRVLETNKPTIVVSHHAPSRKSIHKRFIHEYHMNGGYWSDLEWLMVGYNIPLWIHGHMHDPVEYLVNKTSVRSNPRGYMMSGRDGKKYPENAFFDPNRTTEL